MISHKIAISGNICCGKSTFLALLAKHFGKENVISADEIVTKLYENEFITNPIVMMMKKYNPDIDFPFSKDQIKSLIGNKEFKKEIEHYVHPLVNLRISNSTALFVENPLLFETGQYLRYYESWLVACDPEIQIKRLMERNKYDEETALKWISMQMPLQEKIEKADRVFYNNDTIEELEKSIIAIKNEVIYSW